MADFVAWEFQVFIAFLFMLVLSPSLSLLDLVLSVVVLTIAALLGIKQ